MGVEKKGLASIAAESCPKSVPGPTLEQTRETVPFRRRTDEKAKKTRNAKRETQTRKSEKAKRRKDEIKGEKAKKKTETRKAKRRAGKNENAKYNWAEISSK